MANVMKSRIFRGLFKSTKSKIAVLAFLIIVLVIVVLAAAFLFLGNTKTAGKLICKKNYFLSTSSPYVLPEAGSPNKPEDHKPAIEKKTTNGIYGDQKVPILTYHYVEPVPPFTTLPNLYEDPKVFENQLSVLKNNSYNAIFVRDLGRTFYRQDSIPAHPIILTFDDGYGDFYTTVFPLLKKYNMKAVLYVIVNAVDKPGYITSAQAKEMAHSGYVEIGSHTMDHVNLKKANDKDAYNQLFESKKKLSEIIGKPVEDFAYPFGFFSDRDRSIVNKVGYLTAASTYPGVMQSYKDRFSLFRLRPNNRMDKQFLDWLRAEENRQENN